MKFFIYSRKSVYTGKGESTVNQIEMSRQYIFSKFDSVTDSDITVYEDEGFSGKSLERPGFQHMLKDMKSKKPDYVVCYRLDRISRSVSDFSSLIEELNDRNISFLCIKEEFDTSKPMGKAMMYIASVFAQLERETIAERVRDNMLMLARTGRWLGGTAPTGFTSERIQEIIVDGKVKTSCKLKFHLEEINTVKIMFETMSDLHSISGVSKYLIKQNIKSRTGKFYSLSGIKEILSNPVYCIADKEARDYFSQHNSDVCFEETECSDELGLLSYNKRNYSKKQAPRLPKDQWIIAVGKHMGIISGRKWVSIQIMIESNKPDTHKINMHNNYSLLSGLIYCTNCQERMYAKAHRNITNNGLYYYICENKLRGGLNLCHMQNLNGPKTDNIVCQTLLQYIPINSDIHKLLEHLKANLLSRNIQNPIEKINEKMKKCTNEINTLILTLSHPNLDSLIIQKISLKVSELDKEFTSLSAEKEHLQQTIMKDNKDKQISHMANNLSDIKKYFPHLSLNEKRSFIRLIIQKIEWAETELHLFIYSQ